MVHCVGLYCKNNSSRLGGKHITFHKFPNDDHLRLAWIKFVSRLNWVPTESSRLCSTHFKDEDFVENKSNRILRKGSIPTIHATRLTKRQSSRKVPYACRVPNPSELQCLNQEIALGVPFDQDNPASNETLAKLADSSTNVSIDVVLDSAGKLRLVPTGASLNCKSSNIESKTPDKNDNDSVTDLPQKKLSSPSTVIPTPPLFTPSAIQKTLEQKLKLAEKRYNKEKQKVVDLRKRLKHYQQCTRRLKVKLEKKNEVMSEIVQDAKSVMHEKNTMLDRVGFSKYIVQRQLEQLERNENSKRGYDEELRTFCLELVKISPRAFTYIREKFDNCLPDIKTVQRWKRIMKASSSENDLECEEQNNSMEENDGEALLNESSSTHMEVYNSISRITKSILDSASLDIDNDDLRNEKVLVSDSKINSDTTKNKGGKTNKKSNLFKFENDKRNQNSKSPFKKLLEKSKLKSKPNNKSSGIVVESGSIVKDAKDGKYRIEITNDNVMEIYEIVKVSEGNEINSEHLFNDPETEENSNIKIDVIDHSYIHSG